MIKLVYETHEPCGCESGKSFGECCLKEGSIKLREKAILPTGIYSGLFCRRCLFASDRNCCGHMSGDHIISRNVLRVLSQTKVTISCQNVKRSHSIDSSSLKTKRLCRRHNQALSPIDAEAGRFFRAYNTINSTLNGTANAQRLFLFHGTDIERWLLKTAIMTYYSGFSDINPRNTRLPSSIQSYFKRPFLRPHGLYMKCGSSVTTFRTEASIKIILNSYDGVLCGINVSLGGLELHLLLHTPTPLQHTELIYRPPNLGFINQDQLYTIKLAYDDPGDQWIMISPTPFEPTPPEGIFTANGRIIQKNRDQ